MTTKNDDAAGDLLIREVEEELRHEQLQNLWKKYGSLGIGAALLLVVGVAGWQGWNAWQAKQGQVYSAAYNQASQLLQQGQRDDAVAAFGKIAAEGTKGYKVLSDLKMADLKLTAGDTEGAIALYDRVAAGTADDAYRDLARIKAAYLKVDSADPAALEKSVEPLAAEASPWRHSAREIQALAALKQGNTDKAVELLRKVADDPVAPQGVRARATEMLAAIGPKAKS